MFKMFDQTTAPLIAVLPNSDRSALKLSALVM